MRSNWHRRLGDRLVRRPRQREIAPVRLKPLVRRRMPIPPTTTALLLLTGGFAGVIGIGTIALLLPIAHMPDQQVSFRVALFTATSATCVTGLTVVDTNTVWTVFGQGVIAALMFLGGLGIMTSGALLLLAVGRRLTLSNRLVLQESLGTTTLGTVTALGVQVFLFAVAAQAAGAIFLFLRFQSLFPAGQAAWQSLFHSISAFNNAGFSIMPNGSNMEQFQHDYFMLLSLSILIILGGISFSVIADLAKGRRFNRLRLDTRMVVVGSVALWLVGGLVLFLFEFRNPATLGGLSLGEQAANAAFQSVSGRTAGFTTIDFGLTRSATDFFYMLLMFIGGASASTAGGIKVNTAMVLMAAAWAALQSRSHPGLFKRELPYGQIARALAVLVLALLVIYGGLLMLAALENDQLESGQFQFLDLMFELFSAFGTVGVSTGITSQLTGPSQYLIILIMYFGRLGPMSIALGLALREQRAIFRYAEERVRIG